MFSVRYQLGKLLSSASLICSQRRIRTDHMKVTIRRNRYGYWTLFLSLVWMLCLQSISSGSAKDNTSNAASANAPEDFLEIRGDVPNPRRIDASELHHLPRVNVRTTDPRDPSKEVVYSGISLLEALKVGGLLVDPGMAGIRDAIKMTVLVEATDGYRAVFSLAELDPELTDHIVLLADTKDGQPLLAREGPFRIIVPGDKQPARWVRQVKALTVRKN